MVDQTRVKGNPSRCTDDFLAAYLAEFSVAGGSGQASAQVDDDVIEVQELSPVGRHAAWFSSQTIPLEKRIAPTISVMGNAQSKKVRRQTESLLVLLQCLHFLNKPLSPLLRHSFMTAAEKSIEEYRAAAFCSGEWQLAVSSCSGVMSEVAG